MGQTMTTNKHKLPKGEEVSRNRFDFQNIIGKGGFGKVWRVIDKKLKVHYALKEMQKVKVIDKKSEKSIKYERELLSHLKHPFIVNMYYAFQDYEHLYLVMDLLTGGDLRYHICRHRKFTEEQTPCIVSGLEYIHSRNVIHRDIKPENLVLDDKGYVRITDFGIAKLYSNKNSSETSGTPGYMSPEVMKGQNHSMAVDYFALGVMGYEFMLGCRPYVGKSRKEIKEQMMAKQANIKLSDVPDGWSEEAVDFINKLLIRKPELRLGFKGAQEIKNHPWLKYFQWDELAKKAIKAPFIPDKRDNFDKRYCNNADKVGLDTQERYEKHVVSNLYSSLFENFTYYPILDTNTSNENNDNSDMNIGIHSNHTASKSTITSGTNAKERQLKYSQSKPDLSHVYKRTNQRPGTAGITSPKTLDSLSSNNKKSGETPKINKLSRHNPNSKSTNNFKGCPINKNSVNLKQSGKIPSSNHIVISDNNNSQANKNFYKTIVSSPKIIYSNKNRTKTIDYEALKNNYHSHQDTLMKKRNKSISAVFKHIRASSHINNNINNQSKGNPKGSLQRSSSTYGNISGGKTITNSLIHNKALGQNSQGLQSGYNTSAIKHIPHSAKPSGQTNLAQQNAINKSSTINVLFRNYKVSSSTSGNSTVSSVTNNNNNNKKLK